jgi:hypothetical protein
MADGLFTKPSRLVAKKASHIRRYNHGRQNQMGKFDGLGSGPGPI